MDVPDLFVMAPMVLLLGWAAITDLRMRRIPNWLTLTLVLSGLLQAGLFAGGLTLGDSALGLLAGFALPFVLFAINALGAGDVKLLAGIGAWLGAWPVLTIMLIAAVVGGVLALVQSLWQGRLMLLLGNTALLAFNLANVRRFGTARLVALNQGPPSVQNTLPYAVPIFVTTLGFLALRILERSGS